MLLLTNWSTGQSEIAWSGAYNKETGKAQITAVLEEGWHVYSMFVDEMSGPVSTKFELSVNSLVEVISAVTEPTPLVSYDENFAAELQYFEKTVIFEQELIIKHTTELLYTVTYMICNEVMCYPPVDEIVKISILK